MSTTILFLTELSVFLLSGFSISRNAVVPSSWNNCIAHYLLKEIMLFLKDVKVEKELYYLINILR